jgi:radical SAM protein with 4Fe4S-binding SPASM domain
MTTTAPLRAGPSVIWEMTRACDLACRQCPQPNHSAPTSEELWTYEAYKVVDEIASVHPSRFLISGGDPVQRRDLPQVVDYARRRGLNPIVALSPTALADIGMLRHLRRVGVRRVTVSLDDATPAAHDAFRGVSGLFRATIQIIAATLATGLEVEVNTLVTRINIEHVSEIYEGLRTLPIAAWNLYLIVPRRGTPVEEMPSAEDVERLFVLVSGFRAAGFLRIRMFEAPEERRYEMMMAMSKHDSAENRGTSDVQWADFTGFAPEGEPLPEELFITHSGEVWPGEFLPIPAGNVRYQPLSWIHRNGEIFRALRDRTALKGKCGRCEFRRPCGGSRARAYAVSGDPFETDPLCLYEPGLGGMQAH